MSLKHNNKIYDSNFLERIMYNLYRFLYKHKKLLRFTYVMYSIFDIVICTITVLLAILFSFSGVAVIICYAFRDNALYNYVLNIAKYYENPVVATIIAVFLLLVGIVVVCIVALFFSAILLFLFGLVCLLIQKIDLKILNFLKKFEEIKDTKSYYCKAIERCRLMF